MKGRTYDQANEVRTVNSDRSTAFAGWEKGGDLSGKLEITLELPQASATQIEYG